MPVSDEEVQARRDAIEALRAERDQAKIESETVYKDFANDITMAALDEEEARLKAELDQFKAAADKSVVAASVKAQTEAIGVGGVDVEAQAAAEADTKAPRKTAKE